MDMMMICKSVGARVAGGEPTLPKSAMSSRIWVSALPWIQIAARDSESDSDASGSPSDDDTSRDPSLDPTSTGFEDNSEARPARGIIQG